MDPAAGRDAEDDVGDDVEGRRLEAELRQYDEAERDIIAKRRSTELKIYYRRDSGAWLAAHAADADEHWRGVAAQGFDAEVAPGEPLGVAIENAFAAWRAAEDPRPGGPRLLLLPGLHSVGPGLTLGPHLQIHLYGRRGAVTIVESQGGQWKEATLAVKSKRLTLDGLSIRNVGRFGAALDIRHGTTVVRDCDITCAASDGSLGAVWTGRDADCVVLFRNQIHHNRGHGVWWQFGARGFLHANYIANNGGLGLVLDPPSRCRLGPNRFEGNRLGAKEDSRLLRSGDWGAEGGRAPDWESGLGTEDDDTLPSGWSCGQHRAGRHDVYLCYRTVSEGRDGHGFVEALWKAIEGAGEALRHGGPPARVFWDVTCTKAGEYWDHALEGGVEGARIFVPLVSVGALEKMRLATTQRDVMLSEWEKALAKKRAGRSSILPVFIADVDPGSGRPRLPHDYNDYPEGVHIYSQVATDPPY